MSENSRIWTAVVGAVIGLPTGGLIGFYLVVLLGPILVGDQFAQIGWLFATISMLAGGGLGAGLGAQIRLANRRLFALTVVPLALFLFVCEFAQYFLRRIEQVHTYTVEVTADGIVEGRPLANGREIIGTITADCVPQQVAGTIPTIFTLNANRLEYQLTLINGKKGEWFRVKILVDGKESGSMISDWRLTGDLRTVGIGWWARTGGQSSAILAKNKARLDE